MTVRACLEDQIGRLVHPSAQASHAEAERHRLFIATRLAACFGALAFVPPYLAAGGVPGRVEAAVLAWLLVPLLAAVYVSGTGRIARGEMLGFAGWLGLSATLFYGQICGLGAAAVLLFVPPLEANLSRAGRLGRIAALTCVGGVALLALGGLSRSTSGSAAAHDAVVILAAAAYAALLGWATAGMRGRLHRRSAAALHHLRQITDATQDLVLTFSRSGLVVGRTSAPKRLHGLDADLLNGRGFFERVHVADRPLFLKMVSDAAGSGSDREGVLRLRVSCEPSDDGAYQEPVFVALEARMRRLGESIDGQASDPVAVATFRDVTARIAREAEVEEAGRQAAREQAWRDRFLATVTHELRTPLNAIIGFGEILASDRHAPGDRAKQREYAEIIHTSGLHLLSVVNSVLDMSKIDAGKFEITLEPFGVESLVGACCDMVRLKAEESRVDLVREIEPGLPDLMADERACRQILINLLSNALKFTPSYGCVTVTAKRDGDAMVIAVSDTGIGISPPDMARLGDPFFQAENALDRRYEGTGLGLSVVSGLVGLHGGTITAESVRGEGTRMIVRLPLAGRTQPKSAKAKIQIMARHPQSASATSEFQKVQKIA